MITTTRAKNANLFKLHFDSFGSGVDLSLYVVRVGRPGVVFFDMMGLDEVDSPRLDIDLRDDISDHARSEIVIQLRKQMKESATFSVIIETLNENETVIEQWRLAGCRIIEARFDELRCDVSDGLLIHLSLEAKRIATTARGEMVELF